MLEEVEEGCEWVFDTNKDLWVGARFEEVPLIYIHPSQMAVTISGMLDAMEMHENGFLPAEEILLIKMGEDSYLLRDGHHRWLYGLLLGRKILSAQVIDKGDIAHAD